MDANHLVKVSVFLPELAHLDLKREAVNKRTSLQKVIAGRVLADSTVAAHAAGPAETLESLSLVVARNGTTPPERIDPRTIRKWQNRLKRILESGDRLAVLNCTASIEAMEALIDGRSSTTSAGHQTGAAVNGVRPV